MFFAYLGRKRSVGLIPTKNQPGPLLVNGHGKDSCNCILPLVPTVIDSF